MSTLHRLSRGHPFWTTPRIDFAIALLGAVVASGLALQFGLPLPWLLVMAGFVLSGGTGYAVAWERTVGLYLRVKAHRVALLERVRHQQLPPPPDLDMPLSAVLPPVTKAEVFGQPEETPLTTTTPNVPAVRPETIPTAYKDELLQPSLATNEEALLVLPSRAAQIPARWLTVCEMQAGDRFAYSATSTLTVTHVARPQELQQLDMALVAAEGLGAISLTLPASARWQMVHAPRAASVRCLVCDAVLPPKYYDLATEAPMAGVLCDVCDKQTAGEGP